MPKLIDLTGQTFGELTVTEKAPSKKGHVYWYCECSCGTKNYEVQGTHLKNGKILRCPQCREKNRTRKNRTQKRYPEKKCEICGKSFIPNNIVRKYCYDCSPAGSRRTRGSAITAIRRAIKKQLVSYKGGKCERCGYDRSINALQFHHLNPREKDFDLSVKYNSGCYDMKTFYKEVDKCILVCANCHAEIHESLWNDEVYNEQNF